MLQIESLSTHYGMVRAISGVAMQVNQGEIVTLIGSNGAGKSTTLLTISGVLTPSAGVVRFDGEDITGIKPHLINRRGVIHVPEGRRILGQMTVQENLELGGFRFSAADRARYIERVFESFPRLHERRTQLGGTLSGGEQQMLAIGRALMAKPRLLILDEPSLGLAPKIKEQIFQTLTVLNKSGITMLLVEQNAVMALDIAHRGYVMELGEISLQGNAAELRNNDRVRQAYLGL
jgi:branched-chain amino acid transport system ATP-binding protein